MAFLDWKETWNGTRLDWSLTWAEGSTFELSAPPALTMVGALGIGGDFNYVRALAGAAVARAVGEGTLTQGGPMGGHAVGRAVGQGDLSVGVLLGGAATARAQAAGLLLAVEALHGDALASAIALGTLDITVPPPAVSIGRRGRRRIGRGRAHGGGSTSLGSGSA